MLSVDELRKMVEPELKYTCVSRQLDLLGLSRSTYYYEPRPVPQADLELAWKIDRLYMELPFYGSRRMVAALVRMGYDVGRKRVSRLMEEMGLEAIYQKPRLSLPGVGVSVRYPYLLRDLKVLRPNHVWSADITYIPMKRGHMYLVAVIDWYSRYVLSWRLSNTLDLGFCVEAYNAALKHGAPDIHNTDQGSQFTSMDFVNCVEASKAKVSWDGRGRALDNVFIERLWRSVKYEDIYLKAYNDGKELNDGLERYFVFFNEKRLHQGLDYMTPAELYYKTHKEI